MKSFVYQLPTVMGAIAAMLVTLVSVVNETPPVNCLVKTVAAFTVFAGLGMILRYIFLSVEEERERNESLQAASASLEIAPGTPVSEVLEEDEISAPETEESTAA